MTFEKWYESIHSLAKRSETVEEFLGGVALRRLSIDSDRKREIYGQLLEGVKVKSVVAD